MTSRRERSRGGALLELMVALAVTLILVAATARMVGSTAQVWRRAEAASPAADSWARRAVLRRWIELAEPGLEQRWRGDARQLSFATRGGPPLRGPSARLLVTLSIRSDPAVPRRRQLRAEISRMGPDGRYATLPLETLVVSEGLAFAYLDDGDPDGSAQWLGAWTEPTRAPRLIAITADDPRWPDLIAAPLLAAPDAMTNR